jgi:hypothetical protein
MAEIKAFNSEEFGFIDLQVVALGRPIATLQGLRFKRSQEKSNIHGAGAKPIARGRGSIDYEGSIKILLSEYIAMLQSQGNPAKGITSIKPFDIIASFAPTLGAVVTTFVLVYAEFTEVEVNVNQGDQSIVLELPLVIGDIKDNV